MLSCHVIPSRTAVTTSNIALIRLNSYPRCLVIEYKFLTRCFSFRPHVVAVSEPLPDAAVPEDRRRGVAVTEREGPGLRHHLPDALDSPALHAAVRPFAAGL